MNKNRLKSMYAIIAAGGVVLIAAVAMLVTMGLAHTLWSFILGVQYAATALALVSSACLGGCAAGVITAALWPRRSVLLGIVGVAVAWAPLIAPNPWFGRMPIVWLELILTAIAAALSWRLWQHHRRKWGQFPSSGA